MHESYLIHNIIYSILFGAVFGLWLGLAFRRPRTLRGFIWLTLLTLVSPFIGVSTWIVAIDAIFIIHCNIFLLAWTLTQALCYVARRVRGVTQVGV